MVRENHLWQQNCRRWSGKPVVAGDHLWHDRSTMAHFSMSCDALLCLKCWSYPIQHSPWYSRWASIIKAWYAMRSGTLWGCLCEMMATYKPKAWIQSRMLVIGFIFDLEAFIWSSSEVHAVSRSGSSSAISINSPPSILFTSLLGTGGRPTPSSEFGVSTWVGSGWSSTQLFALVGSMGYELGPWHS